MTAQKGADLVLKIGNGGAPETFSILGGMRTTRLQLNQTMLDASNIESGAWKALQPSAGIRSLQIDVSGIFTDIANEETLRLQAFAGTARNYQLVFGNGDVLAASLMVASYERRGDLATPESYNIQLENAGVVTFTPA